MTKIAAAARAALFAIACALAAPMVAPGAAHAEPSADRFIDHALVDALRQELASPVSVLLLRAQNERHKSLDQARIDALDKEWRAQRKSEQQPLVAQLYGNPLSAYLTRMQADSDGLYTEIFVMDAHGLNVGQSAVTSDYWQGDEDKWQKTFQVGPDAVFVDAPEYDDATRTWRVQVNLSIADPDGGAALGAATVEINLSELARRQGVAL